MKQNFILAFKLQKAYLHPEGSCYLGEKAEILKTRLIDFFRKLDTSSNVVYYVREVVPPEDNFYACQKTHSLVGSKDVEIVESLKPYTKYVLNVSRYNAFYKTALEAELFRIKPEKVILVGVQTHGSILFTAEELRNRGYNTVVIEPLTVSDDDYLHSIGVILLRNLLCVDVSKSG